MAVGTERKIGMIAVPGLSDWALVIGDQTGQIPVKDMIKIERRAERIRSLEECGLTVVMTGKEGVRSIGKGKRRTYPFVGVRCIAPDIFESGVGVMCTKSKEGYFSGWVDVDLLACYRAMVIIGQLKDINPDGDIYDAYDVADATRMEDPPGWYKVQRLLGFRGVYPDGDRADFYDYNAMLALRRVESPCIGSLGINLIGRILRAIPRNLEEIITGLNEQDISVDGSWTLEREIKWGMISPSPVIEAAISTSKARSEERIRKFEER